MVCSRDLFSNRIVETSSFHQEESMIYI